MVGFVVTDWYMHTISMSFLCIEIGMKMSLRVAKIEEAILCKWFGTVSGSSQYLISLVK